MVDYKVPWKLFHHFRVPQSIKWLRTTDLGKNILLPGYPGYPGSLEKKYSITRVVKSRVIWKHYFEGPEKTSYQHKQNKLGSIR